MRMLRGMRRRLGQECKGKKICYSSELNKDIGKNLHILVMRMTSTLGIPGFRARG